MGQQETVSKASISFKKLQGKAHTDPLKAISNEAYENRVNVHSSNVWNDVITGSPATDTNDGIIEYVENAVFIYDASSNDHSWYLTWPAGHSNYQDPNTYGSPPDINQVNRIKTAIPPSYNSSPVPDGYEIAITLVGSIPLSVTDSRDWVFDYENGFFWQEKVTTPAPYTANVYVYIGKTASNAIQSSDLISITNDRLLKSVGTSPGLEATGIIINDTNDISNVHNLSVTNDFSARTKSFLIDHPTKENFKLRYGSLESPYHGIRLTGKGIFQTESSIVILPEYISNLVKEKDINIQLTGIGFPKYLYIEDICVDKNYFIVGAKDFEDKSNVGFNFYWDFTAIRKDIEEMEVESRVN